MRLNPLSSWLDTYLAEKLGEHSQYAWSPDAPYNGSSVLVTVGFMPESPAELLTITSYDFPETLTEYGLWTARVQLRGRSPRRGDAVDYVKEASEWLSTSTVTTRLHHVTRTTIAPIGQDQMGNHEATASLIIETLERTT